MTVGDGRGREGTGGEGAPYRLLPSLAVSYRGASSTCSVVFRVFPEADKVTV
jgi:hypothetical protein